MNLMPILTFDSVHIAAGFTCVKTLDARLIVSHGRQRGVPPLQLKAYAAECGTAVWLERSMSRIAERVAELERALRAAPVQDRAALEDKLRTSRSTLVLLWRGLERSPGLARRLSALAAPDVPQPHLRLVE